MSDDADKAIKAAVDAAIQFHPDRHNKQYGEFGRENLEDCAAAGFNTGLVFGRRELARELLDKNADNVHEPDAIRFQNLCGWLREIAEEGE